jgi:hypothetical protein
MKTITIFIAVVALAVIFVVWWNMRVTSESLVNIPESGPIVLQGKIVCLPHRDSDGPQTLECAYGLYGIDNHYYMLRDETATSGLSAITSIPTESSVEVTGNLTLGEDTRYATVGTISLDSIEITEKNTSMEETHSDGIITFTTPDDFGLAISDEQILINAVIPPCTSGFTYCLYYLNDEYENTNLESAGIAIQEREDLTSETMCLATPPEGYANMTNASTTIKTSYSMSVFTPLQDAGAGHYSNGEEYRLYTDDSCYQIVTSIGESQFENHPAGSINMFTVADRTSLTNKLRDIVSSIQITETGEQLVIPVTI